MDEMVRYIFGNLRKSDMTMSVFARMLRKQRSFNSAVTVFAAAVTTHLIIQNVEIRAMREQIHKLKNEVKGLKNTEGD